MEYVTRPCAHCGDEFTPSGKRYSMAATYCPPCAREYRTEYRAGRADAWHAKRAARCHCGVQLPTGYNKYCSYKCRTERDEPERRAYTCAMSACHNLCQSSQPDAAFCSNSCKLISKKIRVRGPHGVKTHPHWVLSQPMQGPTLDWLMSMPMLGPSLTDWPLHGPTSASKERQCETCRGWFNGYGLTCSRICSDQYHKIVKTNASTLIAAGHCRRCSRAYVRPAHHDASGCCSAECTKRLRRSIRRRKERALKRNQLHEPYTLREIAERDGWRCHLCGGKVPDRQYAARDDDATIDHLIPQSKGGDDIRSNVALAHNRCNWERGDAGLAQLRLVG